MRWADLSISVTFCHKAGLEYGALESGSVFRAVASHLRRLWQW